MHQKMQEQEKVTDEKVKIRSGAYLAKVRVIGFDGSANKLLKP